MTIAEKLTSVQASKDAIKQAIEDKGVACGDVLSEYAEKIADIPTGGVDMSTGVKFSYSTFSSEQFENLHTYNWDKLTDLHLMFYNCQGLTTISLIDLSNAYNMDSMFNTCKSLTTITLNGTSNVKYMSGLCYGCLSLTSVSLLDASGATDVSNMFYSCSNLTDLGGLKNLSRSLSLASSPLLTVESLMNVINNLKDRTDRIAQTLTLGATNLAKLTDEQKAVATNKNWVLA